MNDFTSHTWNRTPDSNLNRRLLRSHYCNVQDVHWQMLPRKSVSKITVYWTEPVQMKRLKLNFSWQVLCEVMRKEHLKSGYPVTEGLSGRLLQSFGDFLVFGAQNQLLWTLIRHSYILQSLEHKHNKHISFQHTTFPSLCVCMCLVIHTEIFKNLVRCSDCFPVLEIQVWFSVVNSSKRISTYVVQCKKWSINLKIFCPVHLSHKCFAKTKLSSKN